MASQATPTRIILRSLLPLAWPLVLRRITESVISVAEALMVAPLGDEALAAVTTGSLNFVAFMSLPVGVVIIVQSFVAQLRGRSAVADLSVRSPDGGSSSASDRALHPGRAEPALSADAHAQIMPSAAIARCAWYGLVIATVAQLLALAALPYLPNALSSLDYAPTVHAGVRDYLTVRLLSVLPGVGAEALGCWYAGLGNTRPIMIASVVAMVAGLAGDYLLIEPRWGLPGFGVAGAAWASTLGSWLGFAVIGAMFARVPGARRSRAGALRWVELSRTLRFGLPYGIGAFLELAAFTLFIDVALARLGTTELAAFNISVQINSISFLPAFGLASAGAILVAEAIGRCAHDEVWPIVKMTAQVTCGWMGSVGLLLGLGSEQLMSFFRPRDTALLEAGSTMLAFSALWQLLDAVGYTFSNALGAAGDTAWCMAARFMLAWFVFMPIAFLAVQVFQGDVVAVMSALPFYVYSLALTATLAARFASGKWRRIDLLGTTPPRSAET